MASIIDNTYFVGKIWLPIDEIGGELTGNIVRLEPEILTKVLGYSLKKAFVDALAETPASKWLDLKNGKDYQIDGIYYNWMGFANAQKQSIIANYVFNDYLSHGSKFNSSFGVRQLQGENSVPIDNLGKQAIVYNEMVSWINSLNNFIIRMNEIDSTTYPNFEPTEFKKFLFI